MTNIAEALKDLDEELVLKLIDEALINGASPIDIMSECNHGIVAVGELFASDYYFLAELMFSAEIMQGAMEKLEPYMPKSDISEEGVVPIVIGTVAGDIHDVGKNIVVSLLKSNGIKVLDLGIDVPANQFVDAVRETGTKVLGLSALLNSTYPEMKKVIDAIKDAGLRDQVKIIIGGTITSPSVQKFTGADAFATEAMTGINYIKRVLNEVLKEA